MDDIDLSTNYFKLFNLPMQNSKESNYKTLQDRLKKLNDRRDEKGIILQRFANKAMQIFNDDKDDTKYNEYLKYWKAKEQGTGNTKKQEQIEEELHRVKEAQQRYQADAQEAKRRVEKAQAEAEAAKRREKEAEETARQAQAELDLQSSTPASKSALELLADVGKYAFGHQSKPSGWQLIGDIANHITTRQNPQLKPSPTSNQQPVIDQQLSVNLNGIWRDPDGTAFNFRQQGNQLSVRAKNLYPLVMGDFTGIVSGREVQLSGFLHVVPYGSHMQMAVTLSEDGLRLEGNSFANGKTFPLTLYRQF